LRFRNGSGSKKVYLFFLKIESFGTSIGWYWDELLPTRYN
jgi:hypothetical protein